MIWYLWGLSPDEVRIGISAEAGPWFEDWVRRNGEPEPFVTRRTTRDRTLEEDLFDRSWAE